MWNRLVLTALAALLPSAQAFAEDAVRYRLDLDISWSAETHPFDFPPVAHLTRLVGATHHSRYTMFADGQTASSGLQSVAERGRAAILAAELEEAKDRERVGGTFEADALDAVPGRMSATFSVTEKHSLVSFVTMVAPSPDWFTGAAGVELFRDGNWVDRYEVTLWAWDAGTDGGTSFFSDDLDTQPRQSIRLLASPHFLGPERLKPIGTAVFLRM